jgi:hypothetical protein
MYDWLLVSLLLNVGRVAVVIFIRKTNMYLGNEKVNLTQNYSKRNNYDIDFKKVAICTKRGEKSPK